MAKKVNITEKLSFDENPSIIIRETELEVNADAATVLKIMGILGDGATTPKQVLEMYHLIFPGKAKKDLEKMKLSFKDLQTVIENAIDLIVGSDEDDTMGEPQTHTMI